MPLSYLFCYHVNPKGNEGWIFTGRTDAEAEASVLLPSDVKSRLIGKDPDAWKDWGQEQKGAAKLPCCWIPSMSQGPLSLACLGAWESENHSKERRTAESLAGADVFMRNGQHSIASCSPSCWLEGYLLIVSFPTHLIKGRGRFPRYSANTRPFLKVIFIYFIWGFGGGAGSLLCCAVRTKFPWHV